MNSKNKRTLYLRWVGANGIGEMLGLGLTLAIGAIVITSLSDQQNIVHPSCNFSGGNGLWCHRSHNRWIGTMVGDASMVPMIQRTAWWFATPLSAGGVRVGLFTLHADEPG
jgi:hypothetical protein